MSEGVPPVHESLLSLSVCTEKCSCSSNGSCCRFSLSISVSNKERVETERKHVFEALFHNYSFYRSQKRQYKAVAHQLNVIRTESHLQVNTPRAPICSIKGIWIRHHDAHAVHGPVSCHRAMHYDVQRMHPQSVQHPGHLRPLLIILAYRLNFFLPSTSLFHFIDRLLVRSIVATFRPFSLYHVSPPLLH